MVGQTKGIFPTSYVQVGLQQLHTSWLCSTFCKLCVYTTHAAPVVETLTQSLFVILSHTHTHTLFSLSSLSLAHPLSLQPPPGKKARALFPFEGQREKELSFPKGAIIDLLHTVNENWLEGMVGQTKGIFPTSHVQVGLQLLSKCHVIMHPLQHTN